MRCFNPPRWALLLSGGLRLCWLVAATSVWAQTNLQDAYSALGFDPWHPNNSVVVLFSDPHMNIGPSSLPVSTNLDSRLVGVINAMDPPPEKILVSGDTSTTMAQVPGIRPSVWSMTAGTNEMLCWLEAIKAITNIAQTNILWTPGNHDVLAFETNAETFRLLYPMMPPQQRVDAAGVRFFLLNCGAYSARDEAQASWLRAELEETPVDQPVVVVTHVPPFLVPPLYRGLGLELREIFADWPARWWTFSGHYHARSLNVYRVGLSNVASMTVGTANPLNSNGASDDSGCLFLCLSNGIAGVVYYHYNDASFEVVRQPDWDNPRPFLAAFEGTPGLLWRRLKSQNPAPETTNFEGQDTFEIDWYSYTENLQWALPLGQHANQATHFLLLLVSPSPGASLYFQTGPSTWEPVSLSSHTNFVYAIPIPPNLATQPVAHVRYTSPGWNDFIAGWGLGTANPPPPRIAPPVLGAEGVEIQLESCPGLMLTVEVSSNLVDWETLLTTDVFEERMTVSDPEADPSRQRFYRAVLRP